jgi:uncharacterized membrane protein
MNSPALSGIILVPLLGALMVLAAVVTRRTAAFGVRIPYPERPVPPVIRRQRLLYLRRTSLVCACATAAALALWGHGPWWLSRVVLLLEVGADIACLQLARRSIIAVKNAEGWYAGLRQAVVTDTGWRADPPRFPVRWLLPALAVLAATLVIGVLRYPHLPALLAGTGGRRVPRSPGAAFAIVVGQAYATALSSGILLLAYRARPDIEARDPAGSAARQRAVMPVLARAVLTLVALVNVTLLLVALRQWQLWRPSGAAEPLTLLPFALGFAALIVMLWRARAVIGATPANGAPGNADLAGVADRDDDRFWKGGIVYVNSGDPAVMVSARFGAGWTLNLGNPRAWMIIAAVIATPAGLAAILLAAGA